MRMSTKRPEGAVRTRVSVGSWGWVSGCQRMCSRTEMLPDMVEACGGLLVVCSADVSSSKWGFRRMLSLL